VLPSLAGLPKGRVSLAMLVTAPWLFRGSFPVNSFSKNYDKPGIGGTTVRCAHPPFVHLLTEPMLHTHASRALTITLDCTRGRSRTAADSAALPPQEVSVLVRLRRLNPRRPLDLFSMPLLDASLLTRNRLDPCRLYKHFLLHGLNASVAVDGLAIEFANTSAFRLYWVRSPRAWPSLECLLGRLPLCPPQFHTLALCFVLCHAALPEHRLCDGVLHA
jgi:hypothetical protein